VKVFSFCSKYFSMFFVSPNKLVFLAFIKASFVVLFSQEEAPVFILE
jgi:hypothetical protein